MYTPWRPMVFPKVTPSSTIAKSNQVHAAKQSQQNSSLYIYIGTYRTNDLR